MEKEKWEDNSNNPMIKLFRIREKVFIIYLSREKNFYDEFTSIETP